MTPSAIARLAVWNPGSRIVSGADPMRHPRSIRFAQQRARALTVKAQGLLGPDVLARRDSA